MLSIHSTAYPRGQYLRRDLLLIAAHTTQQPFGYVVLPQTRRVEKGLKKLPCQNTVWKAWGRQYLIPKEKQKS